MEQQYYLFAKDDIYEENQRLYRKDELIGSLHIFKKIKSIKNLLLKDSYYINNQSTYIEERLENSEYSKRAMLTRSCISIHVKIIDKITKVELKDVHCGFFSYHDIYDENDCLVYFKDDLIMDFYAGYNLIKVPLLNISEGTFYIQQLNTIEGYYGNIEQYLIDYHHQDYTVIIENSPTEVEISKRDEQDCFIEGAWLALYDYQGYLVDEWITDKEHKVYNLVINQRYTIEELYTPKGYKKNKTFSFLVENCQSIQYVTIINEREGHYQCFAI